MIIKIFYYFGLDGLKELRGIFSFVIYDIKKKKVYLLRDVVGVKPLYYFHDKNKNILYFSSLIKPLLLNLNNNKLNLQSLNYYLNFGRNDNSQTLWEGINKLQPGELLIFDYKKIKIKKFLKFKFKSDFNFEDSKKSLELSFNKQFNADVPISILLSGGKDSNTIFKILQNGGHEFTAYSMFFEDNESFNKDFRKAKEISETNKIKFVPVEMKNKDFFTSLENISSILEEPVSNNNSILNYNLANKINEKVILTGDGGDEIFNGYNKYKTIYFFMLINKFITKKFKLNVDNKNLKRLFFKNSTQYYLSFSNQNFYKKYLNFFFNGEAIDEKFIEKNFFFDQDNNLNINNVMFKELQSWVVNDPLSRNDKIFGNFGKEVRVPFLDQNVIENFLMINPLKKNGVFFESKYLLKKMYNDHLKNCLKEKQGFNSPIYYLLGKFFKNNIYEILSEDYYNSNHIINFKKIREFLKKRDAFNKNDMRFLWHAITLQFFLKKFKL